MKWIEVDPIYLTDDKKKPIEVMIFFNRCHYNPDTKRPTLRRSSGLQIFAVGSKAEVEDAVVHFVTKPGTRLLAEGLSANDFRRLPREVVRPPRDVIDGTAKIYEDVQEPRLTVSPSDTRFARVSALRSFANDRGNRND